MACVVRDSEGKLLLTAGWVGEYREISEAELRAAWESLRFMLLHLNGYYVWLEPRGIRPKSCYSRPLFVLLLSEPIGAS